MEVVDVCTVQPRGETAYSLANIHVDQSNLHEVLNSQMSHVQVVCYVLIKRRAAAIRI